MNALVMMLKNTKTNLYHPIMYFEVPLPGQASSDKINLIRYKSKGHRTTGIADREEALEAVESEIVEQVASLGYVLNKELEEDLLWDSLEMPVDIQLRSK